LTDQRLWVYSLALSVVIWYENMTTINYVRGFDFKYTNSKLECYWLSLGNFISGVFGLVPLTNSFVTNLQIRSLRALDRLNYVFGLVILLLMPFTFWNIIKYIPVSILPILYSSMLIAEVKLSDFDIIMKINKKKLFYVVLAILLCFYVDIIYAFVFCLVIYHVVYGYSRTSIYYHFDDSNHFFNRVLKFAREHKDSQDEEQTILSNDDTISKLEEDRVRIGSDCIVYSLLGKYSFKYNDFHLGIIQQHDKNNVIVNFEHIFKQDVDFLANYHKLLRKIQKLGKDVYISGINKDDFVSLNQMLKRSFLSRFYLRNRVYYIN